MISESDKNYLLSLKTEDIDFKILSALFSDTFSDKKEKKSRFKTTDKMVLNANEYINKSKVTTTVGLFIYNKFIVEKDLSEVLGYVNYTIDMKGLGDVESELSKALLDSKITQDQFVTYLNRTQWLAMKLHSVLTGSFTPNTIKPHPKVVARKNQLIKENKKAIEDKDVIAIVKMEKDLIKTAKDALGDDQGLDLYKSGARGTFDNNFKNINIMRGPIYDPVNNKYDIVTSNFMEGIQKKDIAAYGNSIVTGAYPKAISTADSGYLSKQITAAMQTVVLDKPNSDCGTKVTMKVLLKPNLKNDFLYRYILERGKLVLLDNSNISSYINAVINLRTPMYCIGDKICSKCAGDLYYRLNLTNIGLTATRVSSTLLNLNMKKFHDSSVNATEVDLNKLFI